MKSKLFISFVLVLSFSTSFISTAIAKKKNRQTIDLEGADIDGEIRIF